MNLTIKTNKKEEVIDLTRQINDLLSQQNFEQGLCHVFVLHTTAAITTADLDPGTDLDMLEAFRKMIPNIKFRHPHDPSHTPDHILSTLIGPDVTVPVVDGRLVLGTWQRVVLFEFDGPRQRHLVISCILTK